MQLIEVPNCPIDGALGAVRYAEVRDAFFGTHGRWTYRQHFQTGHLWLDPRPADHSIVDLYNKYYTHPDGPDTAATGVWQQSMALVLSAKLGYPSLEKPRLLAKLVSLLPSVATA
jgi:hypothetical protein